MPDNEPQPGEHGDQAKLDNVLTRISNAIPPPAPSKPGNEWKERTLWGTLPPGSKVKPTLVDTKNYIEQGERTWTTGQTVRDILQNHLDANTQKFFDHLVSVVVDTDQLATRHMTEDEEQNFDEFTHTLFLYRKGMQDLTPEAVKEMQDALTKYSQNIPFRKSMINPDKTLNMDELKVQLAEIHERPPQIMFKLAPNGVRTEKPNQRWISLEQLGSSFDASAIVAVRISDEGAGFDSKLTAFYKSTKTGKRHLRGKFGEGSKLSETHLVRNGAKVKMRSVYKINGGENRDRAWQHHALVGDDNIVKLKGIEIDMPLGDETQYGSYTLIDLQRADPQFKQDFIDNINPRNPEGLATNCLEYSKERYYYPMSPQPESEYPGYSGRKPVGVSLTANPQFQYVQGLRIGETKESRYTAPVFSYDFLDSSILRGRDRSELTEAMNSQIRGFWYQAEEPELLEALIRRTILETQDSPPEWGALGKLISTEQRRASPQELRAQAIVLRILPEVIGIEPGRKNVIISDRELDLEENRTLMKTLEAKGYYIVKTKNPLSNDNVKEINTYHAGSFEVYSMTSMRRNINSLIGELDSQDESVRFAEELYRPAYAEIEDFIRQAGLQQESLLLGPDPLYLESVDPKSELPVEVFFDESRGMFRLKIRPESLKAGMSEEKGIDYWKQRMQVEMLATFNRKESFIDRNSTLIHSQEVAQLFQDRTIPVNAPDMAVLPVQFSHNAQPTNEEASIRSYLEGLQSIDKSLLGIIAYDKARRVDISLDEAERIVTSIDSIPTEYAREVRKVLANRVIVDNGLVGFFVKEHTPQGDSIGLVRKRIDELGVVGTAGDKNIYRAGNRLFVLFDIPQDSVIKMEGNTTAHVMYRGKILDFDKFGFGQYDFKSHPLAIDKGCVSILVSHDAEDRATQREIIEFIDALDKLQITTPEQGTTRQIKSLEGIIETPLPIEYGKDEWDNPVRVFEDIVQNHIDASPNGKVDLQYEIIRDGKRAWISADNLGNDDNIVGIMIMDNGKGYTPDDLGTMGKSSKRSPLFAGKYGEGQKMVAASAARNNLSVSFTSLGEYRDREFRWTAAVGTQDEPLVIDGNQTTAKRVVYNLHSVPAESTPTYSSATILRLPNDQNFENNIEWQKWVSVIDPRIIDERGHGGLSRYVINLRPEGRPNIIDLGYMRILLDEPGAIYENGLFISRNDGGTAVGYDVPEIVTTRERNSYDRYRLNYYIAHAMRECRDIRYPQKLISAFKSKYLLPMIMHQRVDVSETDLDFGRLSLERSFVSGKPFWNYVYATELGGYFAHSDEWLRSRIISDERKLRENIAQDPEKYRQDIQSAWSAIVNAQHVSRDKIIPVDNGYESWSAIFPNIEDYVKSLAIEEINIDEPTHRKLVEMTANSALFISNVLAQMRETEEKELVYNTIATSTLPSTFRSYKMIAIQQEVDQEIASWVDSHQLEEAPSRVFVAPANAGYLGIARRDKIGFNESLLANSDLRELVGTSRHELLHKILGLRDYTPEFIMMLLELTRANIRG